MSFQETALLGRRTCQAGLLREAEHRPRGAIPKTQTAPTEPFWQFSATCAQSKEGCHPLL